MLRGQSLGQFLGLIFVTDSGFGMTGNLISADPPVGEDRVGGIDAMVPLPDPPCPALRVGGRLAHFVEQWRGITGSVWVLSVIESGYKIPFKTLPPLSNVPLPFYITDPQEKELVQGEIDSFLSRNAVERVYNVESPGFHSRIFLVPKTNNTWRPVIDLSALNRFIQIDQFSMETNSSIRHAVHREHWAVSIDLTYAYLQIPIHPTHRKYLSFVFEGRVYQFSSLPFGLVTSPRLFTLVMRELASHLSKL